MKSQKFLIEIPPSRIAFIKFIFEGYGHLALVTVKDPKKALLEIDFYPKEKEEIRKILLDFTQKIQEI